MKAKMMGRIFDRRAIIMYSSAMILLILTRTDKDEILVFGLLGGISAGKATGSLNIFEILRWNLCVLPPIAVSILFMMTEFGSLSVYTVLRSRSSKAWFQSRCLYLYVANVLYTLLYITTTFILTRDIDSINLHLYRLVLIFSLHTTMMSLLSVLLLILCRNIKVVFLFFFLIEGFGVAIGSIVPTAAKYMIAFWGMEKNETYLFSNENHHLWITCSVMILILVLCYIISCIQIKKRNPAENCKKL